MKRLICLLSLIPSLAFAQNTIGPRNAYAPLDQPVISGATLGTGGGTQIPRGFSVDRLDGWGLLNLYVDVTDANDSVTSLTLACTTWKDKGSQTITGITRASCSTETITIVVDGVAYNLVEGTNWSRGVSDTTATANLATAINALGKVHANISSNGMSISLLTGRTLWMYTSATACATITNDSYLAPTNVTTLSVGTGTLYNATISATSAVGSPLATTARKRFPIRLDIEGLAELKCIFTPVGATSADTISVWGRQAVKG